MYRHLDAPYLTPGETPTEYECWRFYLPATEAFKAAMNQLISLLSHESSWDDTQGGITAREASEIGANIWTSYRRGCMEIGTIFASVNPNAPEGCLLCDGQTYNQEDFPELFSVIDPANKFDTFFWLPDLLGRTVIGVSNAHPFNDNAGSETVTLTQQQMPSHSHGYTQAVPTIINGGLEAPASSAVPSGSFTSVVGGSQPHDNMMPYTALYYYIVAK